MIHNKHGYYSWLRFLIMSEETRARVIFKIVVLENCGS